ncbi:ROK family transcriptional regulator [Saccharothrix algeriensis]|uniref:NBD/HSP70 family sugar kinase n=1 Tax=Saccharothrix algeriensis TaxID=173560 RepID=A0A8T8HSV7_9PSEU|nr:ROK family transcriptional regulator [Saccharothrix algeriensis]MBM7813015.1 putative NBD/HSP70 family sugar kinase [Saccharothrix algeriensis]QTR01633.1 ROK family transcriptional regulator [Saccharothrix algeriensis]
MREARELLDAPAQGRESTRKRLVIEIMVKSDRQSQLSRRTGVSQALVSTTVQELAREGLVEIDAPGGGRSRGRVRLSRMRGVAVGVDLGFNHISVVARPVDQPHDRIALRRESPGANVGLRRLLPDVLRLTREAVEETGQGMADVVAAGLAVPRMVDPRTGRFTTPVLPPWEPGDEPAADLAAELGVPVAMDNDANLGALAEQTYTSEEAVEHVVYVKASTGVGIGIVVGSNLVRGQRGTAGEIGHLTIDPDGEMCLCGGRGCLDTLVGAESLLAKVKQSQRGAARDVPTTLAALVLKAHNGDAVCRRVLNDAGRVLGFALAQLCNLINPQRIVIGGELAEARSMVLDTCRQELARYALAGAVEPTDGFELRTSTLSPYAEAQGALILGLRSRSSR